MSGRMPSAGAGQGRAAESSPVSPLSGFTYARTPTPTREFAAVFAFSEEATAQFVNDFASDHLKDRIIGKGSYGVVLEAGEKAIKVGLMPGSNEDDALLKARMLNEVSVWRRLGYQLATYRLLPPTESASATYRELFFQVERLPYRIKINLEKYVAEYYVMQMPRCGQRGYYDLVMSMYAENAGKPTIEQKTQLAYSFLVNLINAVDEFHRMGLVHNDMSPANFMVDYRKNTKGLNLVEKVYIVDMGAVQGDGLYDETNAMTTQVFAHTWARIGKHFQPESLKDIRTDYVAMAWSVMMIFDHQKVVGMPDAHAGSISADSYKAREEWLKPYLNLYWDQAEHFSDESLVRQARFVIHSIVFLLTRPSDVPVLASLRAMPHRAGVALQKPVYLVIDETIEERSLAPGAPDSRSASRGHSRERSLTPGQEAHLTFIPASTYDVFQEEQVKTKKSCCLPFFCCAKKKHQPTGLTRRLLKSAAEGGQ